MKAKSGWSGLTASLLLASTLGIATHACAQEAGALPETAAPDTQRSSQAAPSTGTPSVAPAAKPAAAIEVPAGTKVLLALHSGVNTKTAQAGDGVYLASTFPVVVGSRVVIPVGVYVQGVIDKVVRPGHIKGRAEVQMHFTTMIFPNGSVVPIPGVVNSLPGSGNGKVTTDNEGNIEQAKGSHVDPGAVATGAAAGAGGGGIAGAATGHPLAGLAYGALAGGVGGAIYSMFTHNNDLVLEPGEAVEMVLQRPLELQESNLTVPSGTGPVPTVESQQQRPLPKPGRTNMLCPSGTLGCS
jgi:type IV secretion system protein VirB10